MSTREEIESLMLLFYDQGENGNIEAKQNTAKSLESIYQELRKAELITTTQVSRLFEICYERVKLAQKWLDDNTVKTEVARLQGKYEQRANDPQVTANQAFELIFNLPRVSVAHKVLKEIQASCNTIDEQLAPESQLSTDKIIAAAKTYVQSQALDKLKTFKKHVKAIAFFVPHLLFCKVELAQLKANETWLQQQFENIEKYVSFMVATQPTPSQESGVTIESCDTFRYEIFNAFYLCYINTIKDKGYPNIVEGLPENMQIKTTQASNIASNWKLLEALKVVIDILNNRQGPEHMAQAFIDELNTSGALLLAYYNKNTWETFSKRLDDVASQLKAKDEAPALPLIRTTSRGKVSRLAMTPPDVKAAEQCDDTQRTTQKNKVEGNSIRDDQYQPLTSIFQSIQYLCNILRQYCLGRYNSSVNEILAQAKIHDNNGDLIALRELESYLEKHCHLMYHLDFLEKMNYLDKKIVDLLRFNIENYKFNIASQVDVLAITYQAYLKINTRFSVENFFCHLPRSIAITNPTDNAIKESLQLLMILNKTIMLKKCAKEYDLKFPLMKAVFGPTGNIVKAWQSKDIKEKNVLWDRTENILAQKQVIIYQGAFPKMLGIIETKLGECSKIDKLLLSQQIQKLEIKIKGIHDATELDEIYILLQAFIDVHLSLQQMVIQPSLVNYGPRREEAIRTLCLSMYDCIVKYEALADNSESIINTAIQVSQVILLARQFLHDPTKVNHVAIRAEQEPDTKETQPRLIATEKEMLLDIIVNNKGSILDQELFIIKVQTAEDLLTLDTIRKEIELLTATQQQPGVVVEIVGNSPGWIISYHTNDIKFNYTYTSTQETNPIKQTTIMFDSEKREATSISITIKFRRDLELIAVHSVLTQSSDTSIYNTLQFNHVSQVECDSIKKALTFIVHPDDAKLLLPQLETVNLGASQICLLPDPSWAEKLIHTASLKVLPKSKRQAPGILQQAAHASQDDVHNSLLVHSLFSGNSQFYGEAKSESPRDLNVLNQQINDLPAGDTVVANKENTAPADSSLLDPRSASYLFRPLSSVDIISRDDSEADEDIQSRTPSTPSPSTPSST